MTEDQANELINYQQYCHSDGLALIAQGSAQQAQIAACFVALALILGLLMVIHIVSAMQNRPRSGG